MGKHAASRHLRIHRALPPCLPHTTHYRRLLQSGTLEKLSMVRNVIVHERSNEIVGMVISRLHAQDQRSPDSLARLLEVAR
jgi:hypothetical protein